MDTRKYASALITFLYIIFATTFSYSLCFGSDIERPRPTFQIITEVQQRLEVEGRPPDIATDKQRVSDQQFGTESSECEPYGRQSHARGETAVFIQDQSIDQVTLLLKANLFTQGGHYRRCGGCVRGRCAGIFPRDTAAKAKGTAKATIQIKLPPHVGRVPWHLAIQTNHPEQGLTFSVFSPDAKPLEPIQGSNGQYLLAGKTNDAFFVNAEFSKSSRNEGACCNHESTGSVIITARVEQGPVLYSTKLEPYIVGGTLTTSYSAVGVVRKDGLAHCTGTLIGQQTVLTAAHCIAGYEEQIKDGRFTFGFGPSATTPDNVSKITKGAYPNDSSSGFSYNIFTNEDDIGLFYLSAPIDIAPIALHSGSPNWDIMKTFPLLFVGYGYNVIGGDKKGIGMKREAEWRIDRVKNRVIEWDFSKKTTCRGDSGGPTFFTQPDALVLVAVTSEGDDSCTVGRNTRVDAYLGWLQPRILN